MADDAHLTDARAALAEMLAPRGALPAAASLAELRAWVADRVARLLDGNPDLLMHVLYRVDVAEARVKAAFAEAPPEALPEALADLLIDRMLQKLELRRRYASGEPPPEP